jgi:hypothetical protein
LLRVENFWELKRKLYGQDFVSQSVDTVPYALGECVVVCCCCFVVSCEFVKSKKKRNARQNERELGFDPAVCDEMA